MGEYGQYNHSTYVKRFETWNEAKEAAGLEPNTREVYNTLRACHRKRHVRSSRVREVCPTQAQPCRT
ncbi:homing endonuclease associated repeat-containing protein [Natronoglomus mannanivorans]|uniref:homing endonuclease associated repeat-containing protein n=1 Tax=Natronoglomus mannanivorans TaxID=2979990 RepID=UPI003CCD7C06